MLRAELMSRLTLPGHTAHSRTPCKAFFSPGTRTFVIVRLGHRQREQRFDVLYSLTSTTRQRAARRARNCQMGEEAEPIELCGNLAAPNAQIMPP